MRQKLYLDEHALKELDEFQRQVGWKFHLRRRGNVVRDAAEGKTIRALAQEWRVCSKTIWNWLNRYKKKGVVGLYDRPRRRGQLSSTQLQTLARMRYPWFKQHNLKTSRRWSYAKLTHWVRENWHITLTPQYLGQLLGQYVLPQKR